MQLAVLRGGVELENHVPALSGTLPRPQDLQLVVSAPRHICVENGAFELPEAITHWNWLAGGYRVVRMHGDVSPEELTAHRALVEEDGGENHATMPDVSPEPPHGRSAAAQRLQREAVIMNQTLAAAQQVLDAAASVRPFHFLPARAACFMDFLADMALQQHGLDTGTASFYERSGPPPEKMRLSLAGCEVGWISVPYVEKARPVHARRKRLLAPTDISGSRIYARYRVLLEVMVQRSIGRVQGKL